MLFAFKSNFTNCNRSFGQFVPKISDLIKIWENGKVNFRKACNLTTITLHQFLRKKYTWWHHSFSKKVSQMYCKSICAQGKHGQTVIDLESMASKNFLRSSRKAVSLVEKIYQALKEVYGWLLLWFWRIKGHIKSVLNIYKYSVVIKFRPTLKHQSFEIWGYRLKQLPSPSLDKSCVDLCY